MASEPVVYDYGNTIVYEGDTVYHGDDVVASAEEYYQQASEIAEQGVAEVDQNEQWLPLGVFAMVQGEETDSEKIVQLAINQDGVLRGNYFDAITEDVTPIQGSANKETQRVAWTVGENKNVVYETGLYNLTEDETQMLIHIGKDRTQQWTLVRLEEPDEESEVE